MPAPAPFPAIPYGYAYFKGIRREGCLYIDKTRFLHALEQVRFAFFIRPRRFGKSCWLSLLSSYYDRAEAGDFDTVFAGTAIAADPTPNRSRYVVLRFNFSGLGDSLDTLERDFDEYCAMQITDALEANPDLFPAAALERILAPSSVNGRLNALFLHAGRRGIPLYVLIDEYDNFARKLLTSSLSVRPSAITPRSRSKLPFNRGWSIRGGSRWLRRRRRRRSRRAGIWGTAGWRSVTRRRSSPGWRWCSAAGS